MLVYQPVGLILSVTGIFSL